MKICMKVYTAENEDSLIIIQRKQLSQGREFWLEKKKKFEGFATPFKKQHVVEVIQPWRTTV